MTDTELLEIWQTFTQKLQSGRTARGGAQELRVMAEIHAELTRRGYESYGAVWQKSHGKKRQTGSFWAL